MKRVSGQNCPNTSDKSQRLLNKDVCDVRRYLIQQLVNFTLATHQINTIYTIYKGAEWSAEAES